MPQTVTRVAVYMNHTQISRMSIHHCSHWVAAAAAAVCVLGRDLLLHQLFGDISELH